MSHRYFKKIAALLLTLTASCMPGGGEEEAADDFGNSDDEIKGGANTTARPWMVTIQSPEGGGPNGHLCGATLIRSNWVVTAAHCVDGFDTSAFKLCPGVLKASQCTNAIAARAAEVIVHPDFSSFSGGVAGNGDIALIRLTKSYSGALPLATSSLSTAGGTAVGARGWGKTTNGTSPDTLQFLKVTTASAATCKSRWDSLNVGMIIDGTKLCTNSTATSGTCRGDSGGGITSDLGSGGGRLFGIVSAAAPNSSPSTCSGAAPDVHTNVPAFVPWINACIADSLSITCLSG